MCIRDSSNITEKNPSVTEFTQWLKKESPGWEVIYDAAALLTREEDILNYASAFYCNKHHREYEQGLAYLGHQRSSVGPKGIKIYHVSILVEDVGKQKCSGFLKKHTLQK